ncbi:copper resistance protein CopC [Fictibacillus enclensis]|uniref:copper resistance CopC/CopD family protein n=1 Tax=Fictibacillus enclensis TaxID=1017270 RepID=UPI00259FE784|nr:copper resistance protein CopC [Fictibacillus enclensis]MDM5340017.1 copper resistance protein CopC [Fictibacillus enclensis]
MRVFIFLLTAWLLILPYKTEAHAFLVNSNPAPESTISQLPSKVELTFNERLEKELYSLNVLNDKGNPITKNPTKMSQNQRKLTLDLPQEKEGVFTVQYSVISSDGHPVSGAYLFTVGQPSQNNKDTVDGPAGETGHQGSEYNLASLVIRTLYYVFLLLASGWVLWKSFIPYSKKEQKEAYIKHGRLIQKVHLFLLAGFICIQASILLNGQNWAGFPDLLFHTAIGWSWLLSLAISAAGLFLTYRRTWFDLVWVILLLLAKSLNGHAAGQQMAPVTMGLDTLHLLAAALWAGGLSYLFISWKKDKDHSTFFFKRFSVAALISLMVLTLSGLVYTVFLLPRVFYLWDTAWGILLTIKVVIVILVLITGALLRSHKKRKKDRNAVHALLKVDLTLMGLILVIVALFTQLSPTPQNKPLNWDESKGGIHFETKSSVLQPGINDFSIKATSSKGKPSIEKAELRFQSIDRPKVPEIIVPLKPEKGSNGHQKIFRKSGAYPPFSGEWKMTIAVVNEDVEEILITKTIKIYELQL